MAKQTNYGISYQQLPVAFGTGWLVRLERAAFGWELSHYHTEHSSYETDEEREVPIYDEYGSSLGIYAKQKYTKKHNFTMQIYKFTRIDPYSHNILFVLFEMLCKLYSTIRCYLFYILGILLKFIIIPLVVLMIFCFEDLMSLLSDPAALSLVLVYCLLFIVPSLLFAAIGYGLRALFGIDRRIEANLKNAGLKPNWREW